MIKEINDKIIQLSREFYVAKNTLLEEIKKEIEAMKIPVLHKKILRRRFYKRMTLEEVGKEFGITRERVRQIESRYLTSTEPKG